MLSNRSMTWFCFHTKPRWKAGILISPSSILWSNRSILTACGDISELPGLTKVLLLMAGRCWAYFCAHIFLQLTDKCWKYRRPPAILSFAAPSHPAPRAGGARRGVQRGERAGGQNQPRWGPGGRGVQLCGLLSPTPPRLTGTAIRTGKLLHPITIWLTGRRARRARGGSFSFRPRAAWVPTPHSLDRFWICRRCY